MDAGEIETETAEAIRLGLEQMLQRFLLFFGHDGHIVGREPNATPA